jgi:4-amino-4-deoxy-L-arabinose transferase-like glycosyltransferase
MLGSLFFILVMLFLVIGSPICVIFLFTPLRKRALKVLIRLWLIPIILFTLWIGLHLLTEKMQVEQNDYYGEYVVDLEKYPGKQANWQYNHYRFKISKDNKIHLFKTDGDKILHEYIARVTFNNDFSNSRLRIKTSAPRPHIFKTQPTLYRTVWSYYLTFDSTNYGRMFFKKGEWEPIE